MLDNLINIDGTYVNPNWIHFIKPHELHSEANPGYKIYVDMGGEHLEGTTTYKTEIECRDAISKLFECKEPEEDGYIDDEVADRILDKLKDIEEEDDDIDWDTDGLHWEAV